jgi:hypothetical protein
MEWKTGLLGLSLLALLMASGCIGGETPPIDSGGTCTLPKKMIGNICCYDENNNNICDIEDIACPASCDDSNPCTNDSCSADTDFECIHLANAPCCGNGICEDVEDTANVCPEDCTVIVMSDFKYKGTPDYMNHDTFVFIHTGSSESQQRAFYLNMTAPAGGMETLRYTFTCNSTQNDELDSIDSEIYNMTDDDDDDQAKINKLEDENYLIYTNFYRAKTGTFSRDIEELEGGEKASFHFSIQKKDPSKRDDLSCLVKFYFMEPRKALDKWLYISYI